MRPSASWRMPPAALFSVAVLLISTVSAQSDLPTITASTDDALPTASSPTASSPTASSPTASSPTATETTTGEDTTSGTLPALTSETDSAAASTTTGDLPGLTTTAGSELPQAPTLTGLPTLPGGFNYPAPSVPPTTGAPYLQKSNLPEDTVFIVVGAVIAFIAFTILAWRILVAWSINRSVRKAASAGYSQVGDSKPGRIKSGGMGPYGSAPIGSTMSMEKLGHGSRNNTSTSKGAPTASLFFSPTAGAGMHTPACNRNSAYLPSGYYSAGTVAPGNGTGMTTIGGSGDRGSKLRPQSGAFVTTRSIGPSPPDSPDLRPSTAGVSTRDSRSSLNLVPTDNRTPSNYLDDLMSTGVPPVPQNRDAGARQSTGRDRQRRRSHRD